MKIRIGTYKAGSAMFMLLTVVGVLYLFGTLLIDYMTQERTQTTKLGENMQAYYLAEAAVEKAMTEFQKICSQELISDEQEVNEKLLSLLDIDRTENFSLVVKINDGDLTKGGSAEARVTINGLKPTPFKTYIDESSEVPSLLKPYQKLSQNSFPDKALGGYEGMLRIEAKGTFRKAQKSLEIIRDLKVTDLTPPAENYTLFICSKKDEYLRHGMFKCRNWSIVRDLQQLIDELAKITSAAFHENLGNSADNFFWEPNMASNVSFEGDIKIRTLGIIRKLVMSVSDMKIRDYVDVSILKLHPYHWGRIRTNGRLHVYLPFFAADDVINYFEDNSIFSHQRPEIGYLFCNNQLHDPYLSKYTYYEGEVIKYYQKLKPYVLGITEASFPSSDPYTMTTKFDYIFQNPDCLEPMQLGCIKANAKNFCHMMYEHDLILNGTYSKPASVMGLIYVKGNLFIGGRISGKAMIVCEGNIIITGNVVQDSAESFLSLVSLGGSVKFAPGVREAKIESAIYAKNSIVGGEEINIFGNLVVNTLNRQDGEDGELIMPKKVNISYDSKLKSGIATNVCFNISEQITTLRDK